MSTPQQARALWRMNDALKQASEAEIFNPAYHPKANDWWKEAVKQAEEEESKDEPWSRKKRAFRRREIYEKLKEEGGYYDDPKRKDMPRWNGKNALLSDD